MKRPVLAAVLLMFVSFAFCGQVTFDDAEANMLQNSPAIKRSLLDFNMNKAALSRETGNRYDVKLNAGYGYGAGYDDNIITGDNSNFNSSLSEALPTGGNIFLNMNSSNYDPAQGATLNDSVGINIYQPLLRGLLGMPADNSIKSDEYAVQMSKESLRDAVTGSTGTLKKYFVQIYRQQQFLAQNTMAIECARNTLAAAKRGLSAGEQLEAKAFLLSRQAQQAGFENNIKSACEDFLNYAGYDGRDWDSLTIDTSSMTEEAYIPVTLTAELENTLIEVQPQVARAKIRYENTRLWMDQAGWSVFPQLDLNASMQLNGFGNNLTDSIKIISQGREKYYSAGLNFSFDIPNSGAVFDEKYQEARYESDLMNYRIIGNGFRRRIRDAWRKLQQAMSAYEMRKEASEAFLKRLEMVKGAFNAGSFNVREMNQSINDAANALSGEANSYYDYIAALSDWNRYSGKYESYFSGYMRDKAEN
jgi:outer membrane protein TolC